MERNCLSGSVKDILYSFITLIYPRSCCGCSGILVTGEEHLCGFCRVEMPRTDFFMYKENPLTRRFWGRVPIQTGSSLFHFQKGGKVQRVIHHFKYRGNIALGVYLGRLLGLSLKKSEHYTGIDMIIPVPLHAAKERKRGFNQSEVICRGVSKTLMIPAFDNLLIRKEETSTQTRKERFRRWENVSDVFDTPDPQALENKNILLVDDVITTGATLEACAQTLISVPGVKVWIATLAVTD